MEPSPMLHFATWYGAERDCLILRCAATSTPFLCSLLLRMAKTYLTCVIYVIDCLQGWWTRSSHLTHSSTHSNTRPCNSQEAQQPNLEQTQPQASVVSQITFNYTK